MQTYQLKKNFYAQRNAVEAVKCVNLEVNEREIFGFLGPNGAGKITTLRMLTTYYFTAHRRGESICSGLFDQNAVSQG
ncbi:MAG: ATP-binding cassette domain-containing protein [Bacteroidota bacterium]